MSETEQPETTDFMPGDTILENDTGSIAAHATSILPGADTHSVTVDRQRLIELLETDLGDSYDDAWLWSDGDTLAICDHREPINEDDAEPLTHSDVVALKRAETVASPEDANFAAVHRAWAADVIRELDTDNVIVHLDTNYPIIVEYENEGVAIAPRVRPNEFNGGAD